MIRVLIVDDFEVVRRGLKEIFADEFPELEVGESANSKTAFRSMFIGRTRPGRVS